MAGVYMCIYIGRGRGILARGVWLDSFSKINFTLVTVLSTLIEMMYEMNSETHREMAIIP
jgi:hypothetical protein